MTLPTINQSNATNNQAPSIPVPAAAEPSREAAARLKGVFPLRKLSDDQEREVTRLYVETTTPLVEIGRRFGIGQTSVARIAQRRGAALRSPTISRAMASDKQGPGGGAAVSRAVDAEANSAQPQVAALEKPLSAELNVVRTLPAKAEQKERISRRRGSAVAGQSGARRPAARAASAQRRSRPADGSRKSSGGTLRRFLVSFVAEHMVEAKTMRDAIQQTRRLGAADIISIVRMD